MSLTADAWSEKTDAKTGAPGCGALWRADELAFCMPVDRGYRIIAKVGRWPQNVEGACSVAGTYADMHLTPLRYNARLDCEPVWQRARHENSCC